MTLWYLSMFSFRLGPILSFFLSFVGNGGAFFSSVVVSSLPLFTVWTWTYLTRWEEALRLCGGRALPSMLSGGRGLPAAYAQKWLTLLRHSPLIWLVVLKWEWGFVQIKMGLLGGATDSGFLHRLFYCQIIMTSLANINEKLLQTTALIFLLFTNSVMYEVSCFCLCLIELEKVQPQQCTRVNSSSNSKQLAWRALFKKDIRTYLAAPSTKIRLC